MCRKNYNYGTRKFADDVCVSNNMRESRMSNNDIIIGSTRAGKTGGYVKELLMNPNGSLVLSDTKGRLAKMFTPYLESLGYKVVVVDLVNPESSIGYNPLKYIGRHEDGSINEKNLKKLVSLISPTFDATEPIWDSSARRFVGLLIGYVLEALPENEHNMYSVVKMHRLCQFGKGKELLEEYTKEYPDSFTAGRYSEISRNRDAEKMWASVMDFVNNILEPFGYSEYKDFFSKADTIDLPNVGKEKTVVFINSSDNDPSFHILSNILCIQMMQVLIEEADKHDDGALDIPVRVVLDDFAAGPTIDNFDNLISIIASREISVSIILQSISQLKIKYSENAATTVINNCDHILYLAGHDRETAKFIGEFMNKQVNSILTMPLEKAVLIEAGAQGRFVEKFVPYAGCEKLEKYNKSKKLKKAVNESLSAFANDNNANNAKFAKTISKLKGKTESALVSSESSESLDDSDEITKFKKNLINFVDIVNKVSPKISLDDRLEMLEEKKLEEEAARNKFYEELEQENEYKIFMQSYEDEQELYDNYEYDDEYDNDEDYDDDDDDGYEDDDNHCENDDHCEIVSEEANKAKEELCQDLIEKACSDKLDKSDKSDKANKNTIK